MKKVFFCLFAFYSVSHAVAQNVNDLVRYSNIQLQGSARFEAMAGSFGALGSDISTALINPAGYGRFSSSQFHAGLNYNGIQNTNTFQGVVTETSRNPVRPSSIGIVLVNDISRRNKGFLYSQIGFVYNRVDNFTNTIAYKGKLYNSLLDGFAADGNQLSPGSLPPFSTNLAWETYAIDPNGSGGYTPRLTAQDTMFHNRRIESKGGVSEYTFSYSTNYINKLYFGVNWGIRTIRYTENYTHREMLDNASLSLDSFNYQYNLMTRGSGSNLKIGVIYLPFESLRLGLSAHTPTFYSLRDQWSADMTSYHGDTVYSISKDMIPTGDYKYRLRTPARFTGSVAYVFGTRGSINVDLEYVNYQWANLRSTKDAAYNPPPNEYSDQNKEADDLLRPVLNLRVGGELVFQGQYFVRAGYAYYPQPYKENFAAGTTGSSTYSIGAGIKLNRSSIDLAYKIQDRKYNYYAFNESRTQISSVTQGLVLCYSLSF